MDKFCDALGLFFSDSETNTLVDAFAANMTSSSPVIRRTAIDAIIAICKGSRRPYHYLKVFLLRLLEHFDACASDEGLLHVLSSSWPQ